MSNNELTFFSGSEKAQKKVMFVRPLTYNIL